MFDLLIKTDDAWVEAVLGDLDAFLLDHAACERKASAMAMSFVVRYPDRDAILEPMIQLAREELTHFYRVFKILEARGLRFERDEKDPYIHALLSKVGKGREQVFLDRLLMAGVVEARGCERFATIGEAMPDPGLREFYVEIAASEARHADLFAELAGLYFDAETIRDRVGYWLEADAAAIAALAPRPALH